MSFFRVLLVVLASLSPWSASGAPDTTAAHGERTVCALGSGPAQCEKPQGVAVNSHTGTVYVADSGNDRIDAFGPDGEFSSFGEAELQTWLAVDNDPRSPSYEDVYTSSLGYQIRKLTPDGKPLAVLGSGGAGPCQMTRTNDPVAVGPGGQVDLADSTEVAPKIFKNRIERWDAKGRCLGDLPLFKGPDKLRNFAVDSKGDFFVTIEGPGGEIREYSPGGKLLREMGKHATGEGLAIGPRGELFAKQSGVQLTRLRLTQFFAEWNSSGKLVKRFDYLPLGAFLVQGLAAHATPDGQFYASEEEAGVKYIEVPKGPAIVAEPCKARPHGLTASGATLLAEVNPDGRPTTFHFEYSDGSTTRSTPSQRLAGGASDLELHLAAATVKGLAPGTTYECTVVVENGEGPAVKGETGSFETADGQ